MVALIWTDWQWGWRQVVGRDGDKLVVLIGTGWQWGMGKAWV